MCSSHSSDLVLVTEMLSPHWDRPATPGHRHLPNEKRSQQFPNTSHSTSSYVTLATASLPGCLHASWRMMTFLNCLLVHICLRISTGPSLSLVHWCLTLGNWNLWTASSDHVVSKLLLWFSVPSFPQPLITNHPSILTLAGCTLYASSVLVAMVTKVNNKQSLCWKPSQFPKGWGAGWLI